MSLEEILGSRRVELCEPAPALCYVCICMTGRNFEANKAVRGVGAISNNVKEVEEFRVVVIRNCLRKSESLRERGQDSQTRYAHIQKVRKSEEIYSKLMCSRFQECKSKLELDTMGY